MKPKDSLDLVSTVLGSLNGYTFEESVDMADTNDRGFVFKKGMDRKLAAWTTDTQTKTVHLPVMAARFAGTSRQVNLDSGVHVFAEK